ncbi:MAG: carbamoyltransferase HypF [Elusimicrobiota bacterium]
MNKRLKIKGTVQGVGFRPFIYKLAKNMGLCGWVRNTGDGVELEISGSKKEIDIFRQKLLDDVPRAAHIEDINEEKVSNINYAGFLIEGSEGRTVPDLNIPPDIALCDKCLKELGSEEDRRREYPFISCLECGPRFTILESLPYDRGNITLRSYIMCLDCKVEYKDAEYRRYHAQPICCPACGPEYSYGTVIGQKAIKKAADDLSGGNVVAVKGWGGFHLMADAENKEALSRIRDEKKRSHKPIAVVAKDISVIEQYCRVEEEDRKLLLSFRRPIVLLRKNRKTDITESLAPDNAMIGMMLPYSGIQSVLFKYSGLSLMAATSLNRPSAPTIRNNIAAKKFYQGNVLEHDLFVSFTCDDSVLKSTGKAPIMLRRSRGYVPEGIEIPFSGNVLTSGASENINFCYTKGKKAYPSQYLGSIEETLTQEIYAGNIEKWQRIWNYKPELLGCDMHPGYSSTKIFSELAEKWSLPLLKIQHHHAHLAGCAAENGLEGRILGVSFDGTGYGEDGGIWGGEFIVFDYRKYERMGCLKPHPLPGGDAAAKEPWRMAISYLLEAGVDWRQFGHLKNKKEAIQVERMIENQVNSPLSSSAGRFIDAVTAIAGVVLENTYSARAPIALENLVKEKMLKKNYQFEITQKENRFEINTTTVIAKIIKDIESGKDISEVASKFHCTLAKIAVQGLSMMKEKTGIDVACISGGVFCNAYLPRLIAEMAAEQGIKVYVNRTTSPNDNGIAFGQAVIAVASR